MTIDTPPPTRDEVLQIVLTELQKHCTPDAPHPELRTIATALLDGDKLTGHALSGGYTNYSYKLHLQNNPSATAVFGKVAFEHALWANDASLHYSLDRLTTEYELQQRFSTELDGDKVVTTPYFLITDIPHMRIMITEWSPSANVMLGKQFLDTSILQPHNAAVLPKLAQTIARINLSTFDADTLNSDWVKDFNGIAQGFDDMLLGLLDKESDGNDAAITYARHMLGKERIQQMNQAYHHTMQNQECFLHGDFHVINVLVNDDDIDNDNNSNAVLLVDWEMARPGPLGYDVGIFLAYPIELAMFLAARGRLQQAQQMMGQLHIFWKIYALTLMQEGHDKCDEESLKQVLKMVIAGCGWSTTVPLYCMGLCRDEIIKDGLNQEEIQRVYGIYGRAGLKLFEFGYCDMDIGNLSLKQMEDFLFHQVTGKELELLAKTSGRRRLSSSPKLSWTSRRRSSCQQELQENLRHASSGSFGILQNIPLE